MDQLLRLLMGPWTTYILWVLEFQGAKRFGALRRSVPGISSRLLTDRLRSLEAAGIVFRDCLATVPPQVTYGLTVRGRELGTVLQSLNVVARRWAEEDRPPIPEDLPGNWNCSA